MERVQKAPSPDQVRLAASAIARSIREGRKPSFLIDLLDNENLHPVERSAMENAFQSLASPELKRRVQGVREALDKIRELDQGVTST